MIKTGTLQDSSYAEATTLEPSQKSSFDIFSSKDNFDGMASYELSLKWRNSEGTDQYVDNAQGGKRHNNRHNRKK